MVPLMPCPEVRLPLAAAAAVLGGGWWGWWLHEDEDEQEIDLAHSADKLLRRPLPLYSLDDLRKACPILSLALSFPM